MAHKHIQCTVNGQKLSLEVAVGESLLDMLRNRLHLTGTKKGCGVGECGACTVLLDGEAIDSCLFLAVWADGKDIRTIEGESKEGKLSKVQEAFVEEGAVQCGFCTPGFVMSVTALVEKGCQCEREGLKKELSGHMCRCTGYHNIVNAAEKAIGEP
ncbi:2Fe-2S iron-sulfur cluster binding domain-containing protein [Heliobacterium gestii]|uniref:2Fe-2S iron-sulfur cluster binding domain-containing protein n=1 Tax=Heliomicrobium gestii TaxID=2699 RepID=A0A845L6S1_HELGE|nr:xanthine dehydrogenase subunit XdhC [Heliomicrobium gestii]MBM7866954.1 carbon-monoxide dehydrogenase small subunit [Heliomicrobium gestii]MZP42377.1 2Fe-2S iron-sulfur cluster binding domain-containing protein [Heliomicrobium gestii]